MKNAKKLISLVITAAMLFCIIVPCTVFAETDIKFTSADLSDAKLWETDASVKVQTRSVNGDRAVHFTSTKASGIITFSYTPKEEINLSQETEAVFEITVSDAIAGLSLEVELLYHGGVIAGESFTLPESTESFLAYVPTRSAQRADSVRFTLSGSTLPSYLTLTRLGFDNGMYHVFQSRFNAYDFDFYNNSVPYTDGISITPSEGYARISPIFREKTDESRAYAVWLTVACDATGTLSVEAENGDTEVNVSSPEALVSGEHTYSFTVYGAFDKLSFIFDDTTLQNDTSALNAVGGGITALDSVSEEDAGSITSCRYSDSKVTLTGKLFSDASVKYVSYELIAYAIPFFADEEEILSGEPDAKSAFSTQFEMTLEPSEHYALCTYRVFLSDGKEKVPVGDAVFVSDDITPSSAPASVFALEGADTADVFESNASSVTVDLSLDDMIKTDGVFSTELYSFGGEYYYYDTEYLETIDKQTKFYTAAGLQVYLRLHDGGESFGFDIKSKADASKKLAAASFISERYTDVVGFILGTSVNRSSKTLVGEGAKSAAYSAASLTAVLKSGTDRCVVLPFSDSAAAPCEIASSLISYYLDSCHAARMILMYETKSSPENCVSAVTHMSLVSSALGYDYLSGSIVWSPNGGIVNAEITDKYRDLCFSASNAGLRFATLNVTNLSADAELFESLREMMDKENIFPVSISEHIASVLPGEFRSEYVLYDFASTYDTSGWIAGGGGFRTVETDISVLGTRVLRAYGDGDAASGIIIKRFDSTMDLSNLFAEFDLCVTGSDSAEVIMIFGGADSRAKYSQTVNPNEASTLVCDLSEYAGAASVSYVGIIVRGEGDALELSKIKLGSDKENVNIKDTVIKPEVREANPVLVVIILILAAITAAIFFVLLRYMYRHKEK